MMVFFALVLFQHYDIATKLIVLRRHVFADLDNRFMGHQHLHVGKNLSYIVQLLRLNSQKIQIYFTENI